MASGLPGCCGSLPATALLRPLAALFAVDEVEDVAGVVLGLPVLVRQDQHLHAAEPAGQIPPAFGAGLRPQPASLEPGGEFLPVHGAAPSDFPVTSIQASPPSNPAIAVRFSRSASMRARQSRSRNASVKSPQGYGGRA